MKTNLVKKMADLALGVTKANVNSTCGYFLYQSKLPEKSEKLRSK